MIKTWSFSLLKNFEACPYRVFLNRITGFKDEGNEFTQRGNEIHTQIEKYIQGESLSLDLNFSIGIIDTYRDLFINGANIEIEQNWAFDASWRPTDYWNDPWLRVKADVFFTDDDGRSGELVDWKTGKKSQVKHIDQGQLYTIAAFAKYPKLETVDVKFYYVDQNDKLCVSFDRGVSEVLRQSYEDRATKMLFAKEFLPKPSKWNCHYCSMNEHCKYKYED